ncbi:glycosyltransferase family 4 protein [Pelagibacteraceae bacterium]|nr:glycosyltransferase family 4 protein [Pelagibacteraceae bacterium]
MNKKKIVIVGSTASSILKFRYDLINRLIMENYDVSVICNPPLKDEKEQLYNLNIKIYHFNLLNNRIKIFTDIIIFLKVYKYLKDIKPHIVMAYYVKPMIYAGIVTKILNINFFPLITGLTYVFYSKQILRLMVKKILIYSYRFSFSHAKKIIFQNKNDLNYFEKLKISKNLRKVIIEGSGVDSSFYAYKKIPPLPLRFFLAARLLNEKGIIEYLEAASVLKKKYNQIVFYLAGDHDTSYDSINFKLLQKFILNRTINYLGHKKDIKHILETSHVYVLPSYHEGMPRSVLEAMSVGRPIITTNVPGCRETVVDGVNGFLINPKNVADLITKMEWFINNEDKIEEMGKKSREIATKRFDNEVINTGFIKLFKDF